MLSRSTTRLVTSSNCHASFTVSSSATALRHAHLAPASSLPSGSCYAASPACPPQPSFLRSSPTPSTSKEDPTWSEPSYVARYRDPKNHDRPLVHPAYVAESSSPASGRRRLMTSSVLSSTPPASASTSSSSNSYSTPSRNLSPPPPRPSLASSNGLNGAPRDNHRRRPTRDDSPRHQRLEMERAWSGGEASPPIPTETHHAHGKSKRPNYALLYPGSGSQYPLMASFLKNYTAAQQVWKEAEDSLADFESWRRALKLDQCEGAVGELGRILDRTEEQRKHEPTLYSVVFDGGQEELTRAANAQPAILVTSIAFTRTLEQNFGLDVAKNASAILGHSSGEYSAAVASGAIDFADAVKLIVSGLCRRLHGMLTTHALSLPSINLSTASDTPAARIPQMSAVVLNPGHSHDEVVQVVRKIRAEDSVGPQHDRGCAGTVEVASFNSSAQIVLSGSREGIMRASELLREQGIASRAADLPVSAPFHCSFLEPAAEGMRVALEATRLNNPAIPLVSNLDGTMINTTNSLVSNLVAQISLPVRWSKCLRNLAQDHIDRLVFLGPGKALANLARRDATLREKNSGQPSRTEVLSVATDADLEAFADLWKEETEQL
ncbi:BQ2448_648 [Microbotryum intermedium]|uniref:[acyl-carrier-protein] S-malonyltransferase n=1 Tax=Microbotryum intermedium TaxID=269621 RepID=A0A238F609_9BASI|nr:BQ2448_648 [Microbotryum intermedium]